MMLPAFRGRRGPRHRRAHQSARGFVTVDRKQRNKAFPKFGVGVCIAIPPVGPSPVPVGVPKTGFMIESMVTATARNIGALLRGEEPKAEATWNAVPRRFRRLGRRLRRRAADSPRNINWASEGMWVHLAKVAYEKYFLRKMRRGESEPFYEKFIMDRLQDPHEEALAASGVRRRRTACRSRR